MALPWLAVHYDKQRHQTLERAFEVVRLRLEKGWSHRRIGEELGIAHTTSQRLWNKAMEFAQAELAEEAKRAVVVELMRLDKLWEINFQRATDTDRDVSEQQAATDRCLKISEQRRKLLGLDAPERHEISGIDGGAIVFQDIQTLEGEALEEELVGFFNPGYMEGVADGFKAGVETTEKAQVKKKPATKKRTVKKAEAEEKKPASKPKKPRSPAPDTGGGQGAARVGTTVVVAPSGSQGRARV
jgi:hypothetical protein